VVVVGAGVAGVELALCLEARLRASGRACALTLVSASGALLPDGPAALARRVRAEAERRGVAVRGDASVVGVEPGAVCVTSSSVADVERVAADLVLWATGAAPHAFLRASPLPQDAAGFVLVDSTLQVQGHDDLFAVGDCAALADHPWVPRAGVSAVREGPVLDGNLRARLRGDGLRAYRPQRDFLALVNVGEGRAIGSKWGIGFEGAAVWRLKDRIDRRFMRRFQVLDAAGRPAPTFPSPDAMGSGADDEMACGGCAAKLGPAPLRDALARLSPPPPDDSVRLGVGDADDAAAFETPKGDLLLATVDAFRAFTDDPWLVGRVAAVNALSDVQAKGGRPRHALALVTVPDDGGERSAETLYQVLAGMRAALDPLGVSLVGGHSTLGQELFVGLSVTGDLAGDAGWLRLDGLAPGDRLVLTKPLGTGVLLAADMRGLATGRWLEAAIASMLCDNGAAARAAAAAGAHACTDVSGFGLAGHLGELLRASGCSAVLRLEQLPALPGAVALLARGLRSTYHAQNARLRERLFAAAAPDPRPVFELLFDPQTSGGLLFALPAERADAALAALDRAGGRGAARIGRIAAARDDGAWLQLEP
jgi:selenide,water dikinase